MGTKHIKYRKYISNMFDYMGLIVYFAFIRSFLLNKAIYIRILVFFLLVCIFIFIGRGIKTLFDYNYCKKVVKENKVELFDDINVINNFFERNKK